MVALSGWFQGWFSSSVPQRPQQSSHRTSNSTTSFSRFPQYDGCHIWPTTQALKRNGFDLDVTVLILRLPSSFQHSRLGLSKNGTQPKFSWNGIDARRMRHAMTPCVRYPILYRMTPERCVPTAVVAIDVHVVAKCEGVNHESTRGIATFQ